MTATAPRYVQLDGQAYRLQQFLTVRKWLLPNWGQSDVPGVRRWRLTTINAWLDEMTPTERQAAWESLPPATKAARARKWGVR
jgi:hypothetical protein